MRIILEMKRFIKLFLKKKRIQNLPHYTLAFKEFAASFKALKYEF